MRLAVLAALLVVALPVSASYIEDQSDGEIEYQFDGGTDRDAPDSCAEWADLHAYYSPDFYMVNGGTISGVVVPFEDPVDFYGVVVQPAETGMTFRVTFSLTDANLAGYPYDVAFQGPSCSSTTSYTVVSTPFLNDTGELSGDYAIEFVPAADGVYLTGLVAHTPGGGDKFEARPGDLPTKARSVLANGGELTHDVLHATDDLIGNPTCPDCSGPDSDAFFTVLMDTLGLTMPNKVRGPLNLVLETIGIGGYYPCTECYDYDAHSTQVNIGKPSVLDLQQNDGTKSCHTTCGGGVSRIPVEAVSYKGTVVAF